VGVRSFTAGDPRCRRRCGSVRPEAELEKAAKAGGFKAKVKLKDGVITRITEER